MTICRTLASLRQALPAPGTKRSGLVPTMGYLHEGHLSLVRACRRENEWTAVSIYVNPAQFGPAEDLQRYPRDAERDIALLEKEKVDLLFMPDSGEMYPSPYHTYVRVEGLEDKLCGASRPGHFRGVATVVLKLFQLLRPQRAYFGQKDAQQALIIRQMVRDLNLPVSLCVLPIVRDRDGLALSSRNAYLAPAERLAALALPRSLELAGALVRGGETASRTIAAAMRAEIAREPLLAIDYVAVVRLPDLEEIATVEAGRTLIAAAVRVGKTRLIDNLLLGDLSC